MKSGFKWLVLALAVICMPAFLTGCSDSKLQTQNQDLIKQNQDLKQQLAASQQETEAARQEAAQANAAAAAAATQQAPPAAGGTAENNVLPPEQGTTGETTAVHHRHGATETSTGEETVSGIRITHRNGETRLILTDDILFSSGSAKLRPGAEDVLAWVARIIKDRYDGHSIRVEGYTDSRPIHHPYKNNYALGLARAKSVEKYLIAHGVSSESIKAISYGSEHPVSSTNLALNRRVEIVVQP